MNEEKHWLDDAEEMEESEVYGEAYRGTKGLGGDLFGPSDAGPRYRCDTDGLFLGRDVDWNEDDGQPYCPVCGALLERVE